MKKIKSNYSFNAVARTITFLDQLNSITLERILLITNVTSNTIIYNFSNNSLGGTITSNNTLTLNFDTSSMLNSDSLQIIYDDKEDDGTILINTTITDSGIGNAIDCSGFSLFSIQISNLIFGNIYIETSNNFNDWEKSTIKNQSTLTTQDIITKSGIYYISTPVHYLRYIYENISDISNIIIIGKNYDISFSEKPSDVLNVKEISQDETGNGFVKILSNILLELKILNQQINDLNCGTISKNNLEEYRNEISLFN